MWAPFVLLVVSCALVPLSAWLAYEMTGRAIVRRDVGAAIHEGNAAIGMVSGAGALGAAAVLRPVLAPAWRSLTLSMHRVGGLEAWASATGAQLIVSVVVWVVTVLGSVLLFDKLTKNVEERGSLNTGNLAAAWLISGIILGASVLLSEGLPPLLDALVPYPDVGMVDVLE